MQNRKRASSLALLLVAPLALGLTRPWDTVLKDSDHKKIGKEVAAYWEAKTEKKDIQKTFDKLSETIEKTQKKIKDGDILAVTEDWEAIFQYASTTGMKDRVRKGRIATEDMEGAFGELSVTYVAPRKYASKRGVVPVILAVAEEGADAEAYLEESWADEGLREGAVVAVVGTSGVDDWEGQSGVFAVMSTFTAIKSAFAVDYDRVFLAGSGKGYGMAAATASAFPQLFAGLVGLGEVPIVPAGNFRTIPTLFTADCEGSKSVTEQVGNLEFGNCTLEDGADGAAVWAWISEKQRDPYPTQITFSPRLGAAQAAHWLRVDGVEFEASPRIDAVVDREANTIQIDADKISTVEIFFNDYLLALSDPVKVVINGTVHEELVTRNPRTMIDLIYVQGDWGRVFTNFSSFTVPAKDEK